jgi:sec-independent protein translocase protein TatC
MWRRFGLRIFWRVFWILVAFGVGAATAFFYREPVFAWLLVPAGGRLTPFEDGLPIFTNPIGALSATFGVASRAGLVTAWPVAVYAFYTLFTPVLPKRYRRMYKIFTPASALFFLAGAAFAYYVIMPRLMEFLLGPTFTEGIATPLIAIDEYLGLLFNMAFWMGVIFQIPLAMFLLSKLQIISYRRMRRIRRWFAVFAIIFSIIITPTFDSVTMLMMAIPMYLVYEFGLFLAWAARPEEGNYMWLRSLGHAISRVAHWIRTIILFLPVTAPRWMYRKVFRR